MLADLPLGLEIVVAAVFGAMIGSFLNVCILRWGAEPKQSVVHPRSRCPRCGRGLAWYDNIPVLSWLILRARCRGCGEPISVQYPLIELATAAIWAYMVWRYGLTVEALRAAVFGTILLGIAMTDAREYIIPHEFSLGGTLLAVALSTWSDSSLLVPSLQGALVGAGSVLLIGELSEMAIGQEAMGGGDCALMGMIGAFLGWEAIVPVLFLGAVISTFLFLLAAVWSRRTPPIMVEPEAAHPGFRWGLVLRLVVVGALPILFMALALATRHLNELLSGLFQALLGAGIAYYVALLLPQRIARYSWVGVIGLIGAGIAVAAGAGLSLPRLVLGMIIVIGALWFGKRATLVASPATAEGLQSQGYLPFGVGLTAAAGFLLLSGSMPLVRQMVEEYGRLLSYL